MDGIFLSKHADRSSFFSVFSDSLAVRYLKKSLQLVVVSTEI